MIVSVSQISSYLRCKRMWKYAYQDRLAKIVPSAALALGTMVHRAHAKWMLAPDDNFEVIFLKECAALVDEMNEQFTKNVGIGLTNEQLTDIYAQVPLGQAMCRNYQKRWGVPIPKELTVLSPEQEIAVQIPNSYSIKTIGSNSEPDYFHAKLDGILRDKDGRIYVLEHKTYDRRPTLKGLQRNFQFLAYIWTAVQLGIGDVVGIAYDGMWSRASVPKGKDFNELFVRDVIQRNPHALNEFENLLRAILVEMKASPTITFYRRWETCFDCGFDDLCDAESNGADLDYIKKQFFYVREDEQTSEAQPE